MPSPSKKRKLNGDAAKTKSGQPHGLEFFSSKQRRDGGSGHPGSGGAKGVKQEDENENGSASASGAASNGEMTDEELARKLQAEWDKESRQEQEQEQEHNIPSPATEAVLETDADVSGRASAADALPLPVSTGTSMLLQQKNTLSLQSVTTADDLVTATIPLDESPLTFEPAKYIPLLKRQWATRPEKDGDAPAATYSLLTRCFVLVNATQSRIKIVDTLVNCLRLLIEADPASLLPAVWLATNAISPPYVSLELGLGGSAIGRALKKVCGLDARSLKSLFDKYGDPGDVAYEAKKKQSFTLRRPLPLTIVGVFQSLVRIANSRGTGSLETKQRIVDKLLQDARGGDESRYIVRTLCQHLRIGAVKTTMLIALSRAFLLAVPPHAPPQTQTHKQTQAQTDRKVYSTAELARLKKEDLVDIWARAEEIVKACFARRPNYNDLVPALLDVGVCDELLVRCGLALHIPLRPMLGSITRDLGEMLAKLQGRAFTCEYKYDGQRAQVHCGRGETGGAPRVSIFSRHLEVMTDKYPDLVGLIPEIRGEGVDSFILEGEVVAVDKQTGELRTFQALANRARKDVDLGSITIDVCLFAFDLMFLNGQPLLDRSLRERRELLRSMFVEVPRRFTLVQSLDATSEDGDAISAFFRGAVDAKCEGIMVKVLDGGMQAEAPDVEVLPEDGDVAAETVGANTNANGKGKGAKGGRRKPLLATYEPDKRLDSWLKVKKDYGATSDTLDLVPVAAWHGMGRKAKWWSPILMAVRNEETGSLEAVTKCMSGFTDAFYKENRAFYGGSDDNGDNGDNKDNTHTHSTKPAYVEYYGPEPDVWFEPQEVWEMAFADITLSPTYTAAIGLVSDSRGLSLRFPRFLRKRPDKSIDEASTSEFLASLFRKQEAKPPTEQE